MPEFVNKISLHNFVPLVDDEGDGVLLHRLPDRVRKQLNEKAAVAMQTPAHSEIRFVLNEGEELSNVRLLLEADAPTTMSLYCGDYQYFQGDQRLNKEREVRFATHGTFWQLKDQLPRQRFANDVCRIVFNGGRVKLKAVEGNVRPPRPDELPPVLMSYGTSISQGAYASRTVLAWNALTARELGYDLVNLGASGSAFCEKEIADHIAAQPWDMAVFELSVNMVGNGFSVDEFRERATYLINTAAASHPEAPIVCISILPYFLDQRTNYAQHPTLVAYRQTLEAICEASPYANVHFVAGPDLLSFHGLTQDVLHPSDHGMLEISRKLVERIRAIQAESPQPAEAK